MNKESKIKGAVYGLLIGDALGVPYEFKYAEEIPSADQIEFEPPKNFPRSHIKVPCGTWSDDGAQALILLDSLLQCEKFDVAHFAEGLIAWYEQGFMAVDNKVFDVGIQTADSIRQLQTGISPSKAGGTLETSNGNGSLMRVLPLALWHKGSDERLIADAFAQSEITHAHLRSKICCALYCLWARRIIENAENAWHSALETFTRHFPQETAEFSELTTKIFPSNGEYTISGSGYVVDSLRAAVWLMENKKSYEDVVKSAVALGKDTDTTACIAGGIAGLIYGFEDIPSRWRENLRGRETVETLLTKLLESNS